MIYAIFVTLSIGIQIGKAKIKRKNKKEKKEKKEKEMIFTKDIQLSQDTTTSYPIDEIVMSNNKGY